MRNGMLLAALALTALFRPMTVDAQRWDRAVHRMIDRHYAIEFGLIGGVNRNTVTGAGPVDAKFRGSAGGFMSVPLVDELRIRPELLITGKQVGLSNTLFAPVSDPCLPDIACPPINESVTQAFTWLELPVLLEARFNRAFGRWASPEIYGGPFVAVRLACSRVTPIAAGSTTSPNHLVESCNNAGLGSAYNNGDAGFVVGGGLSTGPVGIGVRWTRSLVPIAPSGSPVGPLAGAKHSTVALMVELMTKLR